MQTGRMRYLVASTLLFAAPLRAQLVPDVRHVQELRAAKSLRCIFTKVAHAQWRDGDPIVATENQDFTFHIDAIDYADESARLIGNQSSADLILVAGPLTLTFVEIVPSNAVTVTTVYPWRDSERRFRAVTARHVATGGPTPSQSYGYCQIWQ